MNLEPTNMESTGKKPIRSDSLIPAGSQISINKASTETASTIEISPNQPIDSIQKSNPHTEDKLFAKELENLRAESPKLMTPTEVKDPAPAIYTPYTPDTQKEINQFYERAVTNELQQFSLTEEGKAHPELIAQLTTALATDKVPAEVTPAYLEITQKARNLTQTEFALPDTWFKGTEKIKDWTPVGLTAVEGAAIGRAQTKQLINGSTHLLGEMERAGKKTTSDLPSTITETMMSQADYFGIISDAIGRLKEQLEFMQLQEANTSLSSTEAKKDQIDQTNVQADKQREKMQKQRHTEGWLGIISGVMKWLGPVLAVGGFIATLLTFGAAAPVLIAATAMLAYSVVDSFCGVTQKIVSGVAELVEKALPDSSDTEKSVLKTIIMAAVVVSIIAVGAVMSKGSSLATGSAKAVLTVASKATTLIALQAATMAVMASNAIPELCANFVRDVLGMGDLAANIVLGLAMIAQAAVVVTVAIVVAKNIRPNMTGVAATSTKQSLNATLSRMDRLIESAKNLLSPQLDTLVKIKHITIYLLQILPPSVQAGVGIANGVLLAQSAKFTGEIGEISAQEDLLRELIKVLEDLLRSLQGSVENRSGAIEDIQNLFESLLGTYKRSTDFTPILT